MKRWKWFGLAVVLCLAIGVIAADIENPQAVTFANEYVRPGGDRIAQLYYTLDLMEDVWTAQNVASLIPDTTDVIVDGSGTDGRPPITGADVRDLIGWSQSFTNDMEANNNLKLKIVLGIAVNPGE